MENKLTPEIELDEPKTLEEGEINSFLYKDHANKHIENKEKVLNDKLSNLNDENNIGLPLIDRLMDNCGYTQIHYFNIIFHGCVYFMDSLHIILLGIAFIPFQDYYNLTEYEVGLISCSFFISLGTGSLLATIKIFVDRRQGIILSSISIFILGILLGVFKSLLMFILIRIFIGLCIGMTYPFTNNILIEYLPIKLRGFYFVLSFISYNIAGIFACSIMYLVMPNLEKEKLHLVFIIFSFPSLIFTLIFYLFLKESPRYLILSNREEEGFEIIEKIIKRKITNEERETIIIQVKECDNNKHASSVKTLFTEKFRSITIILLILLTVNVFITTGGANTLTLVLKKLEELEKGNSIVKPNSTILKSKLVIFLISLPSSLIAAIMTEVTYLGRKFTIFTGFLIISIFTMCATLNLQNFSIWIGLAHFGLPLSFSGCLTYLSEVYPTVVRDVATGFIIFIPRLSGLPALFLAIWLYKIYYLSQFYADALVCLVASILTLLLPYDTYGKALDYDNPKQRI